MKKRELSIDIETYSDYDIKSSVYRYVESPNFEVLLLAYAFDQDEVRCIDLKSGEMIPDEVIEALDDEEVEKSAHNANFERVCLKVHFDNLFLSGRIDKPVVMAVEQWRCTMVKAAMLGLPLALDRVAAALRLNVQKDVIGKQLIRFFCIPCKPTKVNEQRSRNLPEHDMSKWTAFIRYCMMDVEVERSIKRAISFYTVPEEEQILYSIDQKINDTGIAVLPDLVRNAINMDTTYRDILTIEAIELTGLRNPNSRNQLLLWLNTECLDLDIKDLKKETLPELVKKIDDQYVKRVITIRQEMSKTSVTKYKKMLECLCSDDRIRGLFQIYGANRTWRWAGRNVQVQNLPAILLKFVKEIQWDDLDYARKLLIAGDLEGIIMAYGNVPDILSQLIRTAFIAPLNKHFCIADFSAIEARVLAWVAGEEWRLEVFRTHGKIYEASATRMFKLEEPPEAMDKNSPYRKKGKVSELALGYQGGVKALIKMGAIRDGLVKKELPAIVKAWRKESPNIVKFWSGVEDAATKAVTTGEDVTYRNLRFYSNNNIFFIQLPSGRNLSYFDPKVKTVLMCFFKFNFDYKDFEKGQSIMMPYAVASKLAVIKVTIPDTEGKLHRMHIGEISGEPFEKMILTYLGLDGGHWVRQDTYGGKLTENIVQAIARDCLRDKMIALHNAGFNIVLHVHDEIAAEEDDSTHRVQEMTDIMSAELPWAPGLPLNAEAYESKYYKKD